MKKEQTVKDSFLHFLKSKNQYTDWLIIALTCIVSYIVIKLCYPYPATISDSGTYVQSAANDVFSFYRPFGYSYFLRIVHFFSASIHSIFIVQILLYFVSVSFLSFTIKYFFPPLNKLFWFVMLFLIVFNPIAFYMSNSIMSDLLFAVMIYVMLASFIFIVKKQSWIALGAFVFSLFCLLHIRYSAMIFPFFFAILLAFFIKDKMRWIALALTLLVFFVFYRQIQNEMKEAVGIQQFSTGFDGWQIANNALHVLPFIDTKPDDIKDRNLQVIHQYMTSQSDLISKNTDGGTKVVAGFMWSNNLPLKQFFNYYRQQSRLSYPVAWVSLGSGYYKQYGTHIITHHPVAYAKYFMLPNAKHIFYPTTYETLGEGELVTNKPDIVSWYNLSKDQGVAPKNDIYNKFVLSYISVSTLITWIAMALVLVFAIVFRKKLTMDKSNWKVFWTLILFTAIYYGSTTFAGPIMLRFWIIMGTFQFAIMYILLNQSVVFKREGVVVNS